MKVKMEQSPAINSNPVLRVEMDGPVLYSNEAGELLLLEWGVRVGEKLPSNIEIFVQRALSRESIEKIEIKTGKRVYFFVFHPLPEKECVTIYGFDITNQKELEGKLRESETQEKANLELANIIDAKAVQSLMNDFYTLAHIPMALLDLKGNILVSVGWQEICAKFHRGNPETCKYCVESDINLSKGVAPGGYKLYKCKNNIWDVVTPIIVEGQHIGNIFSGQFLFNDEPLDHELFRSQARQYGFNEEEYIAALEKVPRLSREAVDTSMAFFTTFANMISQLSYGNIKLSKSLAERDSLVAALQESGDRFRSVLENSLDSAYRLDLRSNYFDYMSPVIEEIAGFSAKEITAMSNNDLLDRIHPDDRPLVVAGIAQSLKNGFGTHEYRFKCKDGKYRWLADHFSIIKDKSGTARFRAGIVRDITERKKAEEALRLSNIYNRSLIEASLDPLVTIGRNGKITDVNNATEKVTGYSRRELIGTDFSDYFTEPEKARAGYQQVFVDGEVRDYPLGIQHKDGHITPVLYNASVYRDENGEVIGIFAAARDITERKRAEEALLESESRLRLAQVSAGAGIWDWDISTDKVEWSEELFYLFGLDFRKTDASLEVWRSVLHPKDRQIVERHIETAINNHTLLASEFRIVLPSGKVRWINSLGNTTYDSNGKPQRMSGICIDITERKQAEEELRESEERFRALVTASSEVVYRVSPDWSEMRQLYGRGFLADTEIPSSAWLHEYVPPEDQQHVMSVINEAIHTKSTYQMEHRVRLADGSLGWIFSRAVPMLDENGEIVEWFGAASDITERKRVEEALRESEERLRLLGDNLPDSAVYQYVHHPDGSVRFLYFSTGIEWLNGVNVQDVLRDPNTLYRQVPSEYLERVFEEEACSARELSDFDMEVPMRLPDGQVKWMRLHSRPRRLPDGRTIWDGVQIDVTKQKQAEEDLKKVHDNLEKLVEERTSELEKAYISLKENEIGLSEAQRMAHIGNWEWDTAAGKAYWSDELYRIFRRDSRKLAPPYNEFLNYIHPEDRDYVDSALKKAVKGKTHSIEYRIVLANGEERTVHMQSEVIFDPNNRPIRMKGIIQDITERKEAEEALANIETARKKEIHHRIKNNLQVISSLLDLQADKFDNPKVIEAFRESQNRVISMALIHEELYKGENTDTLDFSTYIRELAENLFQTYSLSSKNIHLNMDLEENAFFNMDVAVPLGIIVNELVSNSLKHAFAGRESGEIRIELRREKNGKHKKEGDKATSFILIVSDNGIGIPENLNIEDVDSLGIQLITALIDQLDGELEAKRDNGTEFTIKFTVTEENNQALNQAI